ncbi:response regulator transcription factor [Paenibacillus sp. J5C2022]|uniref:response regulator transcription factor n=1 Tax=Paenibacillus sp. J5C2022 TaxID=2977129 RepID=UPI0021CF0110|nr:response regulator transcription factor [Paenibacillus sp. J5C2022]
MENPRVLIVDNEPEIVQLVKLHLHNAGIHTSEAASGRDAISILEHYTVDLIVLDLMMEDVNGWEVLHYMQSRQLDTPVIILSARHLEDDKIETLGLGADDYVTKPFSPGELTARIKALLRRYKPAMYGNKISCGSLIYDRAAQQIEKPTSTISLSPIEAMMLELFMRQPGRIFTKQELFKYVWKLDQFDANSVNVYINFLRKKIERDPANPRYIETIRGVGYRFVEGTHESED